MDFDKELIYEEKVWLLNMIKERADVIRSKLESDRINKEGKCPHRNVINTTTMADPINFRRMLCMDCKAELIFENGILKEVKER